MECSIWQTNAVLISGFQVKCQFKNLLLWVVSTLNCSNVLIFFFLWTAFKVVSTFKLCASDCQFKKKSRSLEDWSCSQSELSSLDVVVSGHQIISDPTRSRPPRSAATLDQRPSPPPLSLSLLWSRRQSLWRFDSETALWVVSDSVRTIRVFHLCRSIDDEAEMRYDTMRCDAGGNAGWMVLDVDEEHKRRGDRRRRRRP